MEPTVIGQGLGSLWLFGCVLLVTVLVAALIAGIVTTLVARRRRRRKGSRRRTEHRVLRTAVQRGKESASDSSSRGSDQS